MSRSPEKYFIRAVVPQFFCFCPNGADKRVGFNEFGLEITPDMNLAWLGVFGEVDSTGIVCKLGREAYREDVLYKSYAVPCAELRWDGNYTLVSAGICDCTQMHAAPACVVKILKLFFLSSWIREDNTDPNNGNTHCVAKAFRSLRVHHNAMIFERHQVSSRVPQNHRFCLVHVRLNSRSSNSREGPAELSELLACVVQLAGNVESFFHTVRVPSCMKVVAQFTSDKNWSDVSFCVRRWPLLLPTPQRWKTFAFCRDVYLANRIKRLVPGESWVEIISALRLYESTFSVAVWAMLRYSGALSRFFDPWFRTARQDVCTGRSIYVSHCRSKCNAHLTFRGKVAEGVCGGETGCTSTHSAVFVVNQQKKIVLCLQLVIILCSFWREILYNVTLLPKPLSNSTPCIKTFHVFPIIICNCSS